MFALIVTLIAVVQGAFIYYLLHNQSYGCLNRAAFNVMYPVLRALGYTFIALDIDKFKGLNSQFGHEQVNRMVKGAIRRYCRSGDLVFSVYSGDEFIVATRSTHAHTMVDRVVQSFADHGMSLTADVVTGTLETSMLKILSAKQSKTN